MTIDTTGGTFIQLAGWCRWRMLEGSGYLHLRCFPRGCQGFFLVLVSKARPPRTFPRNLFPDLLCDLFGLQQRGGRMEYVLWSDQLLIFFVKPVDLCKCSHHSYHRLVIFTLSSFKKAKLYEIEYAKLLSHLSNLEQHLSLKSHQFVSSRSQEEASALVRDKPKN